MKAMREISKSMTNIFASTTSTQNTGPKEAAATNAKATSPATSSKQLSTPTEYVAKGNKIYTALMGKSAITNPIESLYTTINLARSEAREAGKTTLDSKDTFKKIITKTYGKEKEKAGNLPKDEQNKANRELDTAFKDLIALVDRDIELLSNEPPKDAQWTKIGNYRRDILGSEGDTTVP